MTTKKAAKKAVRRPVKKASKTPAKKKAAAKTSARTQKARLERWELRLYIAGRTARSDEALENLERICEENVPGRYRIEVIDLLVNPALASGDQILAVPTLVRKLPPPMKKLIGDFSNTERVLVGLNIRPLKATKARS